MKKGLKEILSAGLRKRTQRRIWAAALAVCMTVTMMPMQTYGVETVQTVETVETVETEEVVETVKTAGLCEHHTAHTLACGYTEATEGSPCMHLADGKEHTEDCYKMTEVCVHEHTAECYDAGAELASDSDAEAPLNCSHVCSEDSGCMTAELDCPHTTGTHDDICGYIVGTAGTACSFICEICNQEPGQTETVKAVLALIEELPAMDELAAMDTESEGFEDYLKTLRADVQAARSAYEALSEEEKAELDVAVLEKLTALEEALAAMPILMVANGIPVLTESSGVYSYQNVKYTLTTGTENTATISGVVDKSAISGDNNVLTIPTQVQKTDGTIYEVTAIASYAFQDCQTLSEVIVPESVTTIAPWAFAGVGSFDAGTVVRLGHSALSNNINENSFQNIEKYPLFYIIATEGIAKTITEKYNNPTTMADGAYGVFVTDVPLDTRFYRENIYDSLKLTTPKRPRLPLSNLYDIGGYDVNGVKDGSDIQTTYGSKGYCTYLSTTFEPTNNNMKLVRLPGEGTETYGKNNIWVKAESEFISGDKYLRVTYTLRNSSDTAINDVSLGVHADVQVGKDDLASIFPTSTGLRLVNEYGIHFPDEGDTDPAQDMQFTLNCMNTAGADDVDTMWYGEFSDGYKNIFTDLNPKGDLTSGVDSVLSFSWKSMSIPANDSITRSVVFGLSEAAAPPELPPEPITLYLTASGKKDITVNAKVTDTAGVTNTLYYTINGGAEHTLGKAVTADGTEQVIAGKIAASNFSADGEYIVKLWIMNSKGVMSEVITKVLTVSGDTVSGDMETGEAPVKPEDSNWQTDITGTTTTWDNGGDISTAAELAQFAYNVNNGKDYSGQTITLTAPIDLAGKDWTPIGAYDGTTGDFCGVFDGNGQTISNLTLSGEITPQQSEEYDTNGYCGLFGDVNQATLKNITLEDVNLSPTLKRDPNYSTDYYIGAVAGSAKESVVNNCHVSGDVVVSGVDSLEQTNVGGVVGNTYNSTIINCSSTGTVGAQNFVNNTVYIGGIVGFAEMYNAGSCVFNSFSTAVLKYENSTGAVARGGIAGTTFYDNAVNNYATSAVAIGGHNDGTVMYNYNPTGAISDTGGYPINGTELETEKMTAVSGTEGALVDLLNSRANMQAVIDLLKDSEVECAHEDVVPFVWTQTGSDYPTLTETPYTPVSIAEVEWTVGGGTQSGTFADALKAMNTDGGSIKLLTDVSSAGVVLPAKPVSIDLNGKNWTTSASIRVIGGSTLTVNDLTTEKTGIITANTGRVVYIDAGGTLNLMGGTLSCTVEGYEAINNSGTVNISGGKATTVGTYAVNNRTDGTFRLTGGSVENTKNFAALGNAGTSYISDGTISSAAVHAVTNSTGGTLHLSGGTLSGNSPTDPTISNQGEIYLSGNPTLSSTTGTHIGMSDATATLIANNGKTGVEQIYSDSKVKVVCASDVAKEGYVAVQGLRDQKHSEDFSFGTAPAGLEYQYNDTDKQIKLVTKIPKYALTVTNGTITSSDTSGTYEENTSVTVTANTAPTGQQFKEWTATGLTNTTYTTNPLTVTMPAQAVTLNAVYEAIPTYTITASPTEKDFGSLEKGYTPPAAQTITVTNTGNTGVTLTQPTNANYTIGTLSSTTVAAGGTATFTIQPGPGLAEGVYDAAITISTNHSTSAAVTVKFTVTPPSITGFTFTQTSGLKEEQDNVKAGAVAGTFSAPQGGTGAFTYTLASNSGNDTDNGKFTIDGTNLKVGSSALTVGTYKAYVLATDTKGKTFGKAITITVAKADPRYTITASPTEKNFGKLVEDYTAPPAAQTITITNTGNQTMTLTQPTGTNFTIGALSKTTIERDETATFTIQPNPGLTEKKYSEIISIKTDKGTGADVTVNFEVTLPPIIGYSFKQNLDLQEENANANAGAIAGEFINPQGGTGEFTYTLVSNSGNNMDNGKFTIEGTNLKIGSSALTEGSYMAYVLATDTKGKTLGKIIPILVKKAKPRYTITASPSDADFGSLVEDYETPPAKKTITVTNTGNQTMTLTQPTGTNFTIGALSSTTIERDKTATFTIQPNPGLTEKEYSETITINTANGTSADVTAKFEVTLPVIDGYTFTQTAGLQEEKANANAGAVAGIFSDPKGGTGVFTYTLEAHAGDDTDNGKFIIDGTNLKVGSSALTVGTYKAYVLATDTKGKTFGKAITITVAKADPRYTITASPSDADFGKLVEDYTAPPAAQTITITNTGNQTMTLTQPTSTNFTIGALSSTTIERDKTATFTIQPKLGLTEKEYSETITINTGNGTSATVTAKFEVTLPVIDGYTFTQTTGLQEEKPNVEAGAVAGIFSDPKGGTGAFTYTLTAHTGDDTNNGRFEIAGTNLKVKGSALTEGTYKAYVLATDTKGKTFGKAITITVAKADPRYTIAASPTDKDFGSVRRKYTAPAAQTITITNTGNQTMTLTPPVSTNYVIGSLSRTTIARDETATFTIQPKTGLNEGVYDETMTINTGNGTSATVAVKFTVTSALVYDLTVNGSYAESTGAGTYEGDAAVNINAGTRSSYTFTGWTSSGGGIFADAGSASTTFTMPEGNVTITAAWRYNGGGGGGSSSGGSGSSGGSSSGTTPPPSQPVVKIPGTGQAAIPTTVDQNGNANVSVTDKNITDAIADAKKDAVQGQPITVEIKVNTDKDASQLITTLPQSVRDTLINNQVGSLTIGSKDVSMNFSQAALSQMNAQAQGNLIITATKADTGKLMGNAQTLIGNRPTYEFKATCDGRIITDLGVNAVTITIPYILKEGETAVNVQAFRVDANGVATVVPGSYYDVTKQAVVFTTGQVSATYGIGYRQTTASLIHTVQRGETLAMIAKRYQTTVQAIAAINGISNPDRIEIGQEIQIPQ